MGGTVRRNFLGREDGVRKGLGRHETSQPNPETVEQCEVHHRQIIGYD